MGSIEWLVQKNPHFYKYYGSKPILHSFSLARMWRSRSNWKTVTPSYYGLLTISKAKMAGYCPNFFCMEQDAIVVHSHTQTKTLTIILQRVIIRIYYMADTTLFLQDTKGNPKGKVYAAKRHTLEAKLLPSVFSFSLPRSGPQYWL